MSNSIILSPNELKDLYDSGNYTITITDNKTSNSIKVNLLNINESNNTEYTDINDLNDYVHQYIDGDINYIIEEENHIEDIIEEENENIEDNIEEDNYNIEDNQIINYESESELDEKIDSEIDNDYITDFGPYIGGPYEIDFSLENILQDYVMFKLISSYFSDINIFVKRKKLLAIYKYYDTSNPYDVDDIHGNYKYFFKIEKYIAHKMRKEIVNHLLFKVNMPGMIKLFNNVPIRLFNTFDIKSLFQANTTPYIKVFYAFM
tara:strand:- start:156 stop:941 length:786 start_codon:yes stop_codon:yes gene_type:complete